MKRICFLVDSIFSIGGVQRVTAVIAKELAKTYDVTIVTLDQPKQEDRTLYGLNETKIEYRFISYPQIGKWKKLCCKAVSGLYLKSGIQSKWASDIYAHSSFPAEQRNALLKELKKGNYDIIVGVHAPLAARLATLRKQLPNTKLIGWLHNSFDALFGEKSMYIGIKRKRYYIYQFRKMDNVVVLCKNDANLFHQFDKQFSPSVIYNPITLKPGKPSTGTSKRFLAIGRFTPLHKGIDLLIEAFHLFAQKDKEWQLHIVGEGKEEQKYNALISKYQLGNRVTIHPFTNQIQDYYSKAQVYVLSSRWEGMPLVLVEAMSHGLPIVTSDLPVCKEILEDFGLYFKNVCIQDLANKLEEATQLDWQKKSAEAIEISKRFDVDHIIEQWKQLIEE
ncbi:MAG: glycosyltransferase family 4 protein [Prevotella sp.]|nr:glycosyltransferase family 4 protein [Prevotella sp.]